MASRKDVYTDEEKAEIAAYVLVNVASGRFVSRVFREDQTTSTGVKLPHVSTFWLWVFMDETGELDEKLVRAREHGIEALLDEVIDITDDTQFDTVKGGADQPDRANTEWISRSRLKAEYRVKLAQMMKPKKYSPRMDVTSKGEKIGSLDALRIAEERDRALTARREKGEE